MNSNKDAPPNQPNFDFSVPRGYQWVLQHGIIGYHVSVFEPWYFLGESDIFSINKVWPQGPGDTRLEAFARRYDTDDIACFSVKAQAVDGIVVIHGWTNTGYDLVASYETFWTWLKSIVDDIAEVVESEQ